LQSKIEENKTTIPKNYKNKNVCEKYRVETDAIHLKTLFIHLGIAK